MEVAVLVLLFTCLLREGIPLFTDLLISQNTLTWEGAKSYCQTKNGRLIILDSQEKWNNFTKQDNYKRNNLDKGQYWTGLRFDDAVQCDTTLLYRPWVYDGWARWLSTFSLEPNGCPDERCVRLQDNWMRTSQCVKSMKALCEIEFSEPTSSMTIRTTFDLSMTPTTEAMDIKDDIPYTTPTEPDVGIQPVVQTTGSMVEVTAAKYVVTSTTPNAPEADESSTVPTTTADVMFYYPPTVNMTVKAAAISTTSPTVTLTSSAVQNATCNHCCVKVNQARQLDQHERERLQHTLRVQLAVNKTNLSAWRRKHISVYDSRPSSVAMGGLAGVILSVVVGLIYVPDFITLGRFVFKRNRSVCSEA